jgi:hypothetical protein
MHFIKLHSFNSLSTGQKGEIKEYTENETAAATYGKLARATVALCLLV